MEWNSPWCQGGRHWSSDWSKWPRSVRTKSQVWGLLHADVDLSISSLAQDSFPGILDQLRGAVLTRVLLQNAKCRSFNALPWPFLESFSFPFGWSLGAIWQQVPNKRRCQRLESDTFWPRRALEKNLTGTWETPLSLGGETVRDSDALILTVTFCNDFLSVVGNCLYIYLLFPKIVVMWGCHKLYMAGPSCLCNEDLRRCESAPDICGLYTAGCCRNLPAAEPLVSFQPWFNF